MGKAIEQARKNLREGGILIGSALPREGELLAAGHNKRVQDDDPITHAEIDCLRNAGRPGSFCDTVLFRR
jgi:creatinine deaminase